MGKRELRKNRSKYDNLEEVLYLFEESDLSIRQISEKMSVPCATIYRWISKFASENEQTELEMKDNKRLPSRSEGELDEIGELKAEITRLRVQLKYQKLRADAYDELINVAESKLGVKIRKKAGAKQ